MFVAYKLLLIFDEIVFYPTCTEKPILKFLYNKFFSIYNYLFRFFCLFGFQWTVFCELCSLVEMMGFEPMTPCLQGRCSPNWATPPYKWFVVFSVLKEVRLESHRMCLCLCLAVSSAFSWTIRPLHFAVTVPLGYSARSTKARGRFVRLTAFIYSLTSLVGPSGLEPPTSCLSGTRSNHLSYEPVFFG